MRFSCSDYGIDFQLKETVFNSLVVENADAFSRITGELWNESNGHDGGISIWEGTFYADLSKHAVICFNPFSLDMNEKKILNRLYDLMENEAKTLFFSEKMVMMSEINSILSKIAQNQDVDIHWEPNIDIKSIFKAAQVEIENNEMMRLTERIRHYIRIAHRLCGTTIFLFINLKNYISEEKLNDFIDSMVYEQVHLIDIEGQQSFRVNGENTLLLDKDLCIINLD